MERWMNGINSHNENTGLSNPVDYQADAIAVDYLAQAIAADYPVHAIKNLHGHYLIQAKPTSAADYLVQLI